MLRHQIEQDVNQLKGDGYSVHRPAVFFLSGRRAAPTMDREWRTAFAELTSYDKQTQSGFAMYPNVVPVGVANADPKTMQQLIHPSAGNKQMKMFIDDAGYDAGRRDQGDGGDPGVERAQLGHEYCQRRVRGDPAGPQPDAGRHRRPTRPTTRTSCEPGAHVGAVAGTRAGSSHGTGARGRAA